MIRVVFETATSLGSVGNYNWFRHLQSTSPPPPPASTPYGGTPWPVPGTFQAENFDEGGQNVASNDTTTGNRGGAYRTTDVDLKGTTDSGGGCNLGWTKAGEWLKYTVNVATAGTLVHDLFQAARVCCFEPLPESYQRIRRQSSGADWLVARNMGLSDRSGTPELIIGPDRKTNSSCPP